MIGLSLPSAGMDALREELGFIGAAGADLIRVDVSDGASGPDAVRMVKSACGQAVLDAHLTFSDPLIFVPFLVEAGADYVTFRAEATPHPERLCRAILDEGALPGMAVRTISDPRVLRRCLAELELVTVMGATPGGGAPSPSVYGTISVVREMLDCYAAAALVGIDGGVDDSTAPSLISAGADVLVSRARHFGRAGYAGAVGRLRRLAEEAVLRDEVARAAAELAGAKATIN